MQHSLTQQSATQHTPLAPLNKSNVEDDPSLTSIPFQGTPTRTYPLRRHPCFTLRPLECVPPPKIHHSNQSCVAPCKISLSCLRWDLPHKLLPLLLPPASRSLPSSTYPVPPFFPLSLCLLGIFCRWLRARLFPILLGHNIAPLLVHVDFHPWILLLAQEGW